MTNLAERSAVHPNANKPQTKTRVEALRILRECSACFTDDDRKRFLKRWLSWRQGPGPPSLRPPDFTHESLNPEGKELTDFHQADLAAIIEGHNSLLREKSDQCSDLIKAALEDYFDSERGFIYSQDEEPPLIPYVQTGGRYTSNSTISIGGWTVVTRFTTADYPHVESYISELDMLWHQRAQSVVEYIAMIE